MPFIRNADAVELSLAEIDEIICKAFDKEASSMTFCDEYHMISDIGEIVYARGFWSPKKFEEIMNKLERFASDAYFTKFKFLTWDFIHGSYTYVPIQ
jgi:hypothetical protein